MTTTESSARASMIDRVALVLDALTGPTGLTLAEIVARTGLPRSSTHRILEQLVKIRWLHREGTRYQLGLGVLELGTLAVHQHRLRGIALPYLHELHTGTRLVVHLAVLDGPEIVYLDKIGEPFGMRLPSRVGGRQPASCTAAGKALLAFADDRTKLAALRLGSGRTVRSITTEHRLQVELGVARERGVAFDREESVPGIGCVAAPIGPPGRPAAAISVCGLISQVRFEQLIGPVRGAASQISNSFTSRPRRLANRVPAALT